MCVCVYIHDHACTMSSSVLGGGGINDNSYFDIHVFFVFIFFRALRHSVGAL